MPNYIFGESPEEHSWIQAIFTRAWNGLKEQGFLQSKAKDACAYRGDEGRKCGIGHCIDDKYYRREFEGDTILNHDIQKAVGLSLGVPIVGNIGACILLQHIQAAHDRHPDPAGMQGNLLALAKDYKLTVPA